MSNPEAGSLHDRRIQARAAFWRCAKDGFLRVLEHAPQVWKNPKEARFYRPEKRLITDNLEPLKQGAMVGILLFATFRFAGSKWFTRFRQRHGINLDASSPGTAATATAPTTTTSSSTATPRQVHAQFQSYSERQAAKASAAWSDASGLTLDIFVSFMAGLSSMFWLLDREQLAQDFARTPLVPGKSLLYDHVCPEMEAAYDKMDRAVWDGTANSSESDERTLHAMKRFVQNCRRRSEYLRSRRERGHDGSADDDRSDIVPHPGLEGAVE